MLLNNLAYTIYYLEILNESIAKQSTSCNYFIDF